MKWLLASLTLVGTSHQALSQSVLKPNDLVAICGDSITEQRIYSVNIEDYLLMCQATAGVNAMQCGWSGASAGSTVTHIATDVATLRPNVVTLYYGMNDGGYNLPDPATEQHYKESLTKLISDFKAVGTHSIVIGSAGIVDSHFFHNPKHKDVTAEQYNETLGRFAAIGKDVAASNGVIFADLHTVMMDVMQKTKAEYGDTYPVEGDADGVHAGPPGHLLMAYCLLKAMGFDGNIGTITYDAAHKTATATDGHRIVSTAPGEVTVESARYPFCFFAGTKDADKADAVVKDNWGVGDAAILKFVPFNQDLNRFTLIVSNMQSRKATVTWGDQSKEFTADQLSHGINLAAEFLKGPFVKPFFQVQQAVLDKQVFESMYIRNFLSDQKKQWMQELPGKKDAIEKLESNFKDIESGFFENVHAAVKPVTHVIKIVEKN